MSENVFLSVIIPCHNEESRIGHTLNAVAQHLNKQNYDAEVIAVDANSTDKTIEVINSKKYLFKNLHILEGHRSINGKGMAIKLGILAASGDYRCFIDADNGAPFDQIDKLLDQRSQYDITIGSRYVEGGKAGKRNILRSIMSRGGNLLFLFLLGLNYKDTRCPLKLFSKEAAIKIFSVQKIHGFGFDTEVLVLARKFGYKVLETPVTWHEVGESKVNVAQDSIKSILEIFQIRWYLISGVYKKSRSQKDEKIFEKAK
ncbi:hypothetical protein COX95_02940 [bacterium CG_4_10_14_0_2_um_filter_33_32]|nr:MAG: hypothetical protein AUJ93_02585 [bacterium CG2_30_33_46]PIR67983.1 MAG: hypothetical protein COU50_00480 [bacterium CG10_big_fil_rev_8_21_14_0_10_33_18]PIU77098.1 MAG: hypothetical protein COS74_00655 [bacterium CG06_land_8_20_14_3_00_33_50]PIY85050.1 MAG: hypothetical protein COY76_04275 [bacterium CG_4_10_14_0_8_um_filter_33_57]PIZ85799.1 MAG: hypothetical protein COX95_02940 [bacterium CG_4_10_14_0_2_um_filter_33_32]